MTLNEVLDSKRDALISLVNKVLDTVYDESEEAKTETSSAYEELRRALIDKVPLENKHIVFLALVVSYHCSRFTQMSRNCATAAEELADILEAINADLVEKNEKLESEIIDFPIKV